MVVLYFVVQLTVKQEGMEKVRLKRKLILKVTFLNVRNQVYKGEKSCVSC